jgi:glycosyltransferase involved in cell wall biosynthesis
LPAGHSNLSSLHSSQKAAATTHAPLRVLQIASGDLWAGAEVQLFNLCQQLSLIEDVELHVVLLNEGQLASRLRDIQVAVAVFDEGRLSFAQIYGQLVAHCTQLRPDILHSHRQKENVLAALCGLRTQTPSVRTAHGASEFNFGRLSPRNFVALLDRWVGRFMQRRVVAVSDDLAQKLAQYYPVKHIEVIRNGIALSKPVADAPVSLPAGHTHIGIVGRLVPVKRIDLFLDTAAALLSDKPEKNFRFWIIGDGPLRAASEAKAESLGITRHIEFVGHVSSAMPYLQSLDLLVMCSDHEGTPMTLLEAMRCELPIVAHNVGGLKELLNAGDCGHLVGEQSPASYAQAICTVIESKDLQQQYATKALQRLADGYAAEKNSAAYLNLYRSVCR